MNMMMNSFHSMMVNMKNKRDGARPRPYIHVIKLTCMRVLNVLNDELVEVMWIDDNEIEYIPIDEFKLRYPHIKI